MLGLLMVGVVVHRQRRAASGEAARLWTLAPGLEDGKPVESWVRVPVHFDPASGGTAAN